MNPLRQYHIEEETALPSLHLVSPVRVTSMGQQALPAAVFTPLQKMAYGLLAVAVVFCAAQAIRCGLVSGFKISALIKQQLAVSNTFEKAQTQQAYLQDKISLYSTPYGIEEMARERLGLVGDNEILVRLYPTATAQGN